MKAIKTTIAQSGPALYIKALIFGTLAGGTVTAVLLLIAAGILLIGGVLPQDILVWITVVLCALASFIGGYTSARITKSKGMMTGAITGAVMFFILLLAGLFISNETLTFATLLKLFALILCGALGGIKAVNRKEKLKIR